MIKTILTFISISVVAISYAQNALIHDIKYASGDSLVAYKNEASNYLHDKSGRDYSSYMAYDGQNETAWCVPNDGIGEWIKFYFEESSHPNYTGIMNVYQILIMNGLVADKYYGYNNRIKKMKVEFSNGEKRIITLKDGFKNYQVFTFNIKAHWVKLTILDIYKGSKYNDTCMSQIDFRSWTHPDDMTPEQRKRRGYDK